MCAAEANAEFLTLHKIFGRPKGSPIVMQVKSSAV
jgi:hypothetical protein